MALAVMLSGQTYIALMDRIEHAHHHVHFANPLAGDVQFCVGDHDQCGMHPRHHDDGSGAPADHHSHDPINHQHGDPAIVFRPSGERPRISEVHLTGNESVPAKELLNKFADVAVGTEFTEPAVRRLLDASIRPMYEAHGKVRVLLPMVAHLSEVRQTLDALARESVTIDEVAHIGAGVSYLQKLDLRFNEEHPPLPKVLAALPLVLRGTHADYSHISWTFSESFFPAYVGQWIFGQWLMTKWNDPALILPWARAPMLLLTLFLGWAVFAYARRLGGNWAGLLCLSVFVSTSTFIAFGPLVITDLPITLFSPSFSFGT